ncbi:DUF488 family protein [Bacteroides sp.]|jgi:hypothetical protein|uniref:DUF488 domain-containing protein n=1 Tax=Bacteroides sp. TaxID=29523 RepID=UPI003AB48F37
MITLYTIGFTQKSAKEFFELLIKNQVNKIVDIRINNTSQLAGFAKGKDLAYLASAIADIGYIHITDFAPTKELLSDYQKGDVSWQEYIKIYRRLLDERKVTTKYNIKNYNQACFLCSETTPEQCHRRLLAEYFKEKCPEEDIKIIHLVK